MAYTYRNDLLAPFLALPQGEKVQAECEFVRLTFRHDGNLTLIDRCLD